ncbi:MAG: glycosyltransferase [Candidatus Sumerlaeia bacterium]|nr:glycosyltransferase [Candidatus Sumerlaeia bacterium]
MGNPLLSIILPVYDRVDHLRVCLDCLAAQTLPHQEWEVILWSDGGPSGIAKLARWAETRIPLRFFQGPNQGPAKARNQAMPHATGAHFLFLNDDIRFAPDYLHHVQAFVLAHPEYAMIGNTRMASEIIKHDIQHWQAHQDDTFYHITNPLQGTWEFWHTLNATLPRRWFDEGHRFDEAFPDPAFEDTEFIYRLQRNHGIPLGFCARAIVEHVHPYTFEGLMRKQRMRGKSAARFVALYPEKYQRIYAVPNDGGKSLRRRIQEAEKLTNPTTVTEMELALHAEFLCGVLEAQ